MIEGISWLGHASFRITVGDMVIYIDPWKLQQPKDADLVLVTHGHRDHLSVVDIAKVANSSTVIVCPSCCRASLAGRVERVQPGDTVTVKGVSIEAVPSYNVDKPHHPREQGNVGYVIELGGRRIYHAGDTDLIPEIADIRCDVALLPAGGKYTMNAAEAAEALELIKPKVAIPMHWGDIVGTREDAERFKSLAPPGVQVEILPVVS